MASSAQVRVRPRERKAQILSAAQRAFAEHGYPAVGMEEIADAVGISGPALYRHFPGKYALFVACARALAQGLLDVWPPLPVGEDADDPEVARRQFERVLVALVRATSRNRRTGSIYQWEGRFLQDADRDEVGHLYEEMIDRVAALVDSLRPAGGDEMDLDLRSAGALSVVASLTAHRTPLALRHLTDVLTDAAVRVVVEPAWSRGEWSHPENPVPAAAGGPHGSRRRELLEVAVRHFHTVGYTETTVEDIATGAGLTQSGFYRHFATKADVLREACLLAADHLEAAVSSAGVRGVRADVALGRLARAYVEHSFAHHDLMQVYYAEVGSLPPTDRSRLRALQRIHVDLWTDLLAAARTDLDRTRSRFVVHAALGAVTDLGRRTQWRDDDATRHRVHDVVLAILGAPRPGEGS
jgi:AcrR family transcriptional regulator